MRIERRHNWGVVVKHGSGELCLLDGAYGAEFDERRFNLNDDHLRQIEDYLDEEDVSLPLLSGVRLEALFGRVDFGGYWSPWVCGDTMEEVMEQLDDLYGIYNDYL